MDSSPDFEALVPEPQRHPRGWPMRLRICGQPEARRHAAEWGATHLVTLKAEELRYLGPAGFAPERHLTLQFADTRDEERLDAPTLEHIAALCAFVDALPADARLLLHCLRGISRGPAMALGLLAREVPPVRAGTLLHRLRPEAEPNKLLVQLWDEHLKLDGALVRVARNFPTAVWKHGDGTGKAPPEHKRKQA
jgi:predicted protein tyrosine phosphatase